MNKHKLFRGMTAAALAAALAFGSPALPETITGLSGLVFDAEAASSDFTIDKSGTITGYKGNGGKVTIPSKINGITVKKIGDRAFQYSQITEVSIPNTVTKIGEFAFSSSKLTKVTMTDSVKNIGSACFTGCNDLKSIKLSNSITKIEPYSFEGCFALESLIIPKGVNEIGIYAFQHSGIKKINIPEGVKELYYYTFNDTPLTEITIPDSVKEIGSYCFQECFKLKKVTLGKNLEVIASDAFQDCISLETIHIPAKVKSIGSVRSWGIAGRESVSVNLSDGLIALKKITVDKNNKYFKTIDGILFSKDGKELIHIPLAINKNSYTIPNSVTKLRENIYNNFSVADSLNSIKANEEGKEYDFYEEMFKRTKIKKITIPGTVDYVSSSAFWCSGIETVIIEDGVTSIDPLAFDECRLLKKVSIPDSVKFIGRSAFSFCVGLTSITIPDDLIMINSGAFTGCKNLKTITIPKNIKSVDKGAFNYCDNLKIKYKGKTYTPEAFAKLSICN